MGDHYVPRFYLKGFASGDSLWVYDSLLGQSFKSTPKSVANENEMYGDELERSLANHVEAPAIPAIEKIRRGDGLSVRDREALSRYIINLWKRVPKGRDRVAARIPEVAESVRKDLHDVIERISLSEPEGLLKGEARKARVDSVIDSCIDAPSPDIWRSVLAKPGSGLPESALLDMNWNFLQAKGKDFFLTCDNPVFFFESEGVGSPQSEVTLPLSSSVCLWAHRHSPRLPQFYEARRVVVKAINRRIAFNASRFVFSERREAWILPFSQKGKLHELSRFTF